MPDISVGVSCGGACHFPPVHHLQLMSKLGVYEEMMTLTVISAPALDSLPAPQTSELAPLPFHARVTSMEHPLES